MMECDHKCHKVGLNPWVEVCPICGCPNKDYDPKAKVPEWLLKFMNPEYAAGPQTPAAAVTAQSAEQFLERPEWSRQRANGCLFWLEFAEAYAESRTTELQRQLAAQKYELTEGQKYTLSLEAEITRLRERFTNLVNRLDFVHASEAYKSVWIFCHTHGMEYTGPQYHEELEAARAALSKCEPNI